MVACLDLQSVACHFSSPKGIGKGRYRLLRCPDIGPTSNVTWTTLMIHRTWVFHLRMRSQGWQSRLVCPEGSQCDHLVHPLLPGVKALFPAPEGEPTGDPVPAPQPSLPEGYVKIGPDEVVIRKGILRGIKRGAELALRGSLPVNFSAGSATAGDVPFWLDPQSEDDVYCSLCQEGSLKS